MSTTFQMPPALEEQLITEARRLGQAPETLLQTVVLDWLRRHPLAENISYVPQGSVEWNALLGSLGAGRPGVILSEDTTRRDTIYGDDLR